MFFSTVPASTELYTLSLHDALPISATPRTKPFWDAAREHRLVLLQCASCGEFRHPPRPICPYCASFDGQWTRSEEHTSELQSRRDLVCRLLLEKKNGRTSQRRARHN